MINYLILILQTITEENVAIAVEQLTSVVAGTPEEEQNDTNVRIILSTLRSVAFLFEPEHTQLSTEIMIQV